MRKILILSVLGFILGNCASIADDTTITIEPVDKAPLVLPKPGPIVLRDTPWIVITPENSNKVLQENKVIFGLPASGYENLNLNLNDILSYIREQTTIISAYEDYYEK